MYESPLKEAPESLHSKHLHSTKTARRTLIEKNASASF
jgi:hypothetical protein